VLRAPSGHAATPRDRCNNRTAGRVASHRAFPTRGAVNRADQLRRKATLGIAARLGVKAGPMFGELWRSRVKVPRVADEARVGGGALGNGARFVRRVALSLRHRRCRFTLNLAFPFLNSGTGLALRLRR